MIGPGSCLRLVGFTLASVWVLGISASGLRVALQPGSVGSVSGVVQSDRSSAEPPGRRDLVAFCLRGVLEAGPEGIASSSCLGVVRDVEWLARVAFSESDRVREQRLVAWVVRNRVESGMWPDGYAGVATAAFQFSAFNDRDRRARLARLSADPSSGGRAWHRALVVAAEVLAAEDLDRPFSADVLHFYSPVSMVPAFRVPDWAVGRVPIPQPRGVDPDRFLFFAGLLVGDSSE